MRSIRWPGNGILARCGSCRRGNAAHPVDKFTRAHGGSDEAQVKRRAVAIGRQPAELRENGVAGTPDEVAAGLRSWRDVGAERVYLQVLDLADLDHLDIVANEVAPLLG